MKAIRVGLDGLTATEKTAKALFIHTRMTGNANFTTPVPTLATLDAARQDLEDAVAAALDGGKAAVFAKNEAEKALDEIITQLAGYVMSVAGDDEVKILSSGFELRRAASPIGVLPAPRNMSADLTDFPGQVKLDWDGVKGAALYQVFQNDTDPDDALAWKVIGMTTQSRMLVNDLESGKTYWFRANAVGTAGESPMSDPATSVAR